MQNGSLTESVSAAAQMLGLFVTGMHMPSAHSEALVHVVPAGDLAIQLPAAEHMSPVSHGSRLLQPIPNASF